jgi:hypothetical protein
VEENKEMELVSFADSEVDDIHNAIGLLEEIKGLVILLPLDELNGIVVEFSQDNGYFVLRHT